MNNDSLNPAHVHRADNQVGDSTKSTLQFLLQNSEPAHALEKVFSLLNDEQRRLLQKHLQEEALKFQQQQQQQQQQLEQTSEGFASPVVSEASPCEVSIQQERLARQRIESSDSEGEDLSLRRRGTACLFFSGLVDSDAAPDCLDILFEASLNPAMNDSHLPLRSRQLPASFFSGPQFSGSDSDSEQSSNCLTGLIGGLGSSDNQPPSPPAKQTSIARKNSDRRNRRTPPTPSRRHSLGKIHSANSRSVPNLSQIDPMARLPPGWRATSTPEGLVYYVNDQLGQSSWIDPRMFNSSAQPTIHVTSEEVMDTVINSSTHVQHFGFNVRHDLLPNQQAAQRDTEQFRPILYEPAFAHASRDINTFSPFSFSRADSQKEPPNVTRGVSLTEFELDYFRSVKPQYAPKSTSSPFFASSMSLGGDLAHTMPMDQDLDMLLDTLHE